MSNDIRGSMFREAKSNGSENALSASVSNLFSAGENVRTWMPISCIIECGRDVGSPGCPLVDLENRRVVRRRASRHRSMKFD